jgi:hypothetical protein
MLHGCNVDKRTHPSENPATSGFSERTAYPATASTTFFGVMDGAGRRGTGPARVAVHRPCAAPARTLPASEGSAYAPEVGRSRELLLQSWRQCSLVSAASSSTARAP